MLNYNILSYLFYTALIVILTECDSSIGPPNEDPCANIPPFKYAPSAYGDILWSPVGDSIIFQYMPIIRVYFDDTLHWWKYEFDEEKTGIYSKGLASQDTQHLILK